MKLDQDKYDYRSVRNEAPRIQQVMEAGYEIAPEGKDLPGEGQLTTLMRKKIEKDDEKGGGDTPKREEKGDDTPKRETPDKRNDLSANQAAANRKGA